MKRNTKVISLDDHPLFSEALQGVVRSMSGFDLVAALHHPNDLFEHLRNERVDIILLDLSLPGMSGFEVLRIISKKYPKMRVIIVSTMDNDGNLKKAYKQGCMGFIPKESSTSEIKDALEKVKKGHRYVPEKYKQEIIEIILNPSGDGEDALTEREQSVLRLVCSEFNSKEIAEHLSISVHTVNAYRKSILLKTGSENIVSLIKYAYLHGYLD